MAESQKNHKDEKTEVTKKHSPVPEGKMKVKVYAPFRDYFEGLANSISAVNLTGAFDILPGHHKFLALLSPCEIEIRTDEGSETVKIAKGIMYVKEDRVTVFLDV